MAYSESYYEEQPDGNEKACIRIAQDASPFMLRVHPQGWLYFSCAELQVITDDDIRQPDVYEAVTQNCSRYPLSELDEGMEVQVNGSSAEGASLFFLVVNHTHCVASYVLHDVKSVNLDTLDIPTLNRCRRLYWNFLQLHPCHVPTPARATQDAGDALTWFYTDNLISGSRSVVPFSKTECEDLFRTLHDTSNPCSQGSVARTVFLAWLLREVSSFRDAESYGQYTHKQSQAYRSTRKPPPFSMPHQPTHARLLVNLIINVLCFSIPKTYLAHVETSSHYHGRLTNIQVNWQAYIQRLVREYSEFLLISTVLLSATVGFLAVPDIGPASQAAGIISAFSSLGSIIVGVFCIWRHQVNTTSVSFIYMHNARRSLFGLHGHAILLSLPPVLLVWAIVTFAVSIIAYTLQSISAAPYIDRATAWTAIGIFMLIFLSVTAGLYTFSIIWKFRPLHRNFWRSWRFHVGSNTPSMA